MQYCLFFSILHGPGPLRRKRNPDSILTQYIIYKHTMPPLQILSHLLFPPPQSIRFVSLTTFTSHGYGLQTMYQTVPSPSLAFSLLPSFFPPTTIPNTPSLPLSSSTSFPLPLVPPSHPLLIFPPPFLPPPPTHISSSPLPQFNHPSPPLTLTQN